MKFILKISLLLIICTSKLDAQNNWYKELAVPNIKDGLVFKTISLPNDEYLILSIATDTANQQNRVKLIVSKTDNQLNLIWTKKYDSPKHSYVYSFSESGTLIKNGFIYLKGCLLSSANQNVSTLIKLNMNGDTLWQKFYTGSGSRDAVFQGITATNDSHLAITGFSQDWTNHTQECLLMKLDTLGNEVWRKYIVNNQAKKVVAGFKIIQDTISGKFYMIGYKYLGTNSQFTSAGSLIITDSIGGVIRQVTLNNEDGGPFYDMIQTRDSNFVAGGGWNTFNDLGGEARIKNMIIKFNKNGDTLWVTRNDIPSILNNISNLIETKSGDILALGIHDTMKSNNLFPIMRLRMINLSSNGVIKWKRNSRYAYDKNYSMGPTCVTSLGEKGYLIGTWGNYNSRHVHKVLKIDTLGCDTLPGFCDYEDLTVGIKEHFEKDVSVRVYPNPSQGSFMIEAGENYSGAEYHLIDMLGRTVYHGTIEHCISELNVSDLSPGVYTLQINKEHLKMETIKIILQY